MQRQGLTFPKPSVFRKYWGLAPRTVFLNHGSFGACPKAVLAAQTEFRRRMEAEPIEFLWRRYEEPLDRARNALAKFVGARAKDLVFVPNATTAVNAVVRSLELRPGDELLTTAHDYNACRNVLVEAARRARAKMVVADVPFPVGKPEEILEAIMRAVTRRTRLAMIDHVSSHTALIFPIKRIIRELEGRGVDTLVDGAHAPGMVPLNLRSLRATYYTGNCHKWICAPKGAGFLQVKRDRQKFIRPLSISHGANSPRRDRSPFLIEFGWTGTWDPSAFLSIPEALRFMGALLPGGWPAVMQRNRRLVLAARKISCRSLGIDLPCPDDMIGSLASVPLPDAATTDPPGSPLYLDSLQDRLLAEYGIEVPIIPWPAPPKRQLRLSAQLYNSLPQFRLLACALKTELASAACQPGLGR